VVSDRAGIPLAAIVSAANVNDHLVLDDTLDALRPIRQPVGRPRKRPVKLHGSVSRSPWKLRWRSPT
jgi:hypothetical protein